MKRDMELVRKILLFLEDEDREYHDGEGAAYMLIKIDGYTKEEIDYHLTIMLDGGLITGSLPVGDNEIITHIGVRLDWNSHDFIETFRSDTIWNKSKEHLKEKGLKIAHMPMDILIEVGKSYIRNLF